MAAPSFGPAPVGDFWEEQPPDQARPVSLQLVVRPASSVSAEMDGLRAQLRQLEERLTREAQTWAQQRQEMSRQLADKDATIAKLMNGEKIAGGGAAAEKPKPKKRAATSPGPGAKKAGTAAAAAGGKAKAKAAPGVKPPAKPKPSSAAASAASSPTKSVGGATAASAVEASAAEADASASSGDVVLDMSADASAADGSSSVDAPEVSATDAAPIGSSSLEVEVAADADAPPALVTAATQSSGSPPSGSAAAAGGGAAAGGAADASFVGDGESFSTPQKSPPKGFRPRPQWVPSLEIRLAMVKSPRKAKPLYAAPKPSGLKPPGPTAAATKLQAQNKKLVQQMGGVNGFAPKPGAKAGAKPAGGAKPKPGGAGPHAVKV